MSVNALIIEKSPSEEYKCNICDDIVLNDTIIGLHCDPTKHIFCYQCILDWYTVLKKNTNYSNYQSLNMCPICKKNGGKLPICNNVTPIKGIHNMRTIKKIITCGSPLKSNPSKKCCSKGQDKYGGKCHIHKEIDNSILEPEKVALSSTPKIKKHLCNAPLITKIGQFCMATGSHKYAGRCGRHQMIPPDDPEEASIVI